MSKKTRKKLHSLDPTLKSLAAQTSATNETIRSFAVRDQAANEAARSFAAGLAAQTSAANEAIRNFAARDWAANEGIRSFAAGLAAQTSATNEAIRNFADRDWAAQIKTISGSFNTIQSFDFSGIYNNLKSIDIGEINEVIEIYGSMNDKSISEPQTIKENSTESNQLTPEEILKIVDTRIATHISESTEKKRSFKDFIYDLATSLGVDGVKYLIVAVFMPYLLQLQVWLIENHELIIQTIQSSIEESTYLIGYAGAKKVLKEKNLTKYDKINLIGIVRKDTFLRESNSKSAQPVISEMIKTDTVVNILQRTRSWVKIQVLIANEQLEGWVEESIVVKFKRKK
ncbi:hypothetical protein [Lysinibacillus xylanilyticus]|uniref:hypothetical protein n=1 Tax=Lysinibacillus xylanilyticus TaxID=582475 RepID=UPI003CFDADDC